MKLNIFFVVLKLSTIKQAFIEKSSKEVEIEMAKEKERLFFTYFVMSLPAFGTINMLFSFCLYIYLTYLLIKLCSTEIKHEF